MGWYWLTTRGYDPALKRFLQPDPSEMDGLFSYVYVSDDPVDGSDPSGFGPDTGTYYRVVSGAVDKAANWSLPADDLDAAIASQQQYYKSKQANSDLPVFIDGLSVWATAQQVADNYKRELAAGKAHGTVKIIAITAEQIQVAGLQPVEDPIGNPELAAKVGASYDPLKAGHYLLIPDDPSGATSAEQSSFQALGQSVNQVPVGRVTAGGTISLSVQTEPSQGAQNSSLPGTIANALVDAGRVVAQAAVEVVTVVLVAGGLTGGGRNRMMAF